MSGEGDRGKGGREEGRKGGVMREGKGKHASKAGKQRNATQWQQVAHGVLLLRGVYSWAKFQ